MRPRLVLLALALSAAALGCGGGGRSTSTAAGETNPATPAPAPSGRATPPQAAASRADWPLFGLTAQRPNATERSSGVSAARLRRLRRIRLSLPGTVDSSPIYLHGVGIRGARHDAFVVTTTYGRTLALNAADG